MTTRPDPFDAPVVNPGAAKALISGQDGAPPDNTEPSNQDGAPPDNTEPSNQDGAPPDNTEPSNQDGAPPDNTEPSNQDGAPPDNTEPSSESTTPTNANDGKKSPRPLNVMIDYDLWRDLKIIALDEGTTSAAIVRGVLEKFVARKKKAAS